MTPLKRDKYVIECWLKVYDRLCELDYKVVDWPDKDSSKKAIDAVCEDGPERRKLGIEHTLIQAFEGEKGDTARFEKTLVALENDPTLLRKEYLTEISQPVGAVPTGVDWSAISEKIAAQLSGSLSTMEGEGCQHVLVGEPEWSFKILVARSHIGRDYPGRVLVGRIWPGDPGPAIITQALEDKVPKLSTFTEGKRILLLEKDGIAGTIEQQFGQIVGDDDVRRLLSRLDEVWSTNTAFLHAEGVIFTNQVWPEFGASTCSLNLLDGRFWLKPSWSAAPAAST